MNNVSTETIVRTIILFITILNNILTMSGKNPLPFSEDALYTTLSAIASGLAALWAWWKNNSFTKPAIEGDKVMNELKQDAKM